ncbi:hypothetical protein AB1Y20_000264 [Prymnesium parvum]|uniref:ferredoxin:thioredoxin reductase n=1 Tax=Prymnesium parvum TaxID=97485 RepID=A0AB34K5D8_PRYPA
MRLALLLALLREAAAYSPTSPPSWHANTRTAQLSRGPAVRMAAEGAEGPGEDAKMDKALKAMVFFANAYCKNTGTTYCADPSIPAYVLKGLAQHKVKLGAPLCPCRHYEDKEAEAKDGYWNCPCVPMRERHECHCMLFLTADNEFAGTSQSLTYEETVELTGSMGSID